MKFVAIVRTTIIAPDQPVLDDAWSSETAEASPGGVRQSLADALLEEGTHRAAVVAIEVPDEPLLAQLERPIATVPGDVARRVAD